MPSNYQTQGTTLDSLLVRRDLLAQGGLWNWGSGFWGQIGNNTSTDTSSPVQTISGGINWKQMSIGENFAGGIKTDGTLWLWGQNTYAALGTNNTTNFSSPVQTVAAGTNWRSISCMRRNSAAIKTDGTLWLWGNNNYGQLGNNTVAIQTASPVQTVSGGTDWSMVAAGTYHTAAIKINGTLWTWGSGSAGRLGDNTLTGKSSPVQTATAGFNWTQVAAGNFTIAVKNDGTLWTWGLNNFGQLGDNTRTDRSGPIQTIASGTNWRYVSASFFHAVATKTDGTLWTWGLNSSGQLGDGTNLSKSSPVQTVSGGTNWKLVSCGRYHTATIKADGTLWTWGQGASFALGNGTTPNRSSPVQTMASGTNWTGVAAGSSNSGGITDIF